ncbi:glycosyltransferase family 4 protein [Pelotomaculum propionicicum]|uniref:Alpha-monoglucosyldiacylglycerol synthase n=1 Tax=Pelotomaculum propionicicum TaxID=258475 RepID=A0A4Y7RLY6_9FIRM|nr:glycosyltransferase family 4 protein [Pelotomaculum propionicicum]NLI13691.1 glycosyltransferase family 4 protein [Peptococcaceae bacterium]TEB10004.1 Alpha-monoglucosyldiacylglycerol synthase [Pelotomaculum propionicicum]
MRIGIFTDSYLPYTSGVVRSIQTFTEELTTLGHEVYIFAPSYRNCDNESRVFRFASIPSPTNPDFTLAVPFSLKLKPTITRLELDLIHVHSPFLLGRVGARYARKLGVPLVFTYHTLYDKYVHYLPFAQSYTKELAQKISRDFCNLCDLVIVPTDIIGDYLHEIGVLTEVNRVPTGIKISDYQKGDPEWLQSQYKIKTKDKVLLFVGRLGKEKNICFLLESFKILNKIMENTVLVLVGGGPEEEELKEKAVELGIENRVIFTGTLPPEVVVNCYAGSSLFVFPSVTETQGIVIAEAKAAGLPVVAIKAYGVSEMVEDGVDGYLTEPVPEEFAAKILTLLKNDKLKEELGKRARQNAEKLSSTNCTARLVESYQEVLDKKDISANNAAKGN